MSQSPGFHFSFVELAPGPGAQGAKRRTFLTSYLRQSQLASLGMPNVSYASAADQGDPFSPNGWWHPRAKQPVAARLAAATLRDVYGQTKLVACGPTLLSAKPLPPLPSVLNSDAAASAAAASGYTLTFGSAAEAQGLHLKPTRNCSYVAGLLWKTYGNHTAATDSNCCSIGPPFEILFASTGLWSPAAATIGANGEVTVTGGGGKAIGVRYGWADYPLCMLYNQQGLVASPFSRASCEFDAATKWTSWPMLDNVKGEATAGTSSGAFVFIGNTSTAVQCAQAALAHNSAVVLQDPAAKVQSYTWFAPDFHPGNGSFASSCFGRIDTSWQPTNGCPNGDPGCGLHNATSGQICA